MCKRIMMILTGILSICSVTLQVPYTAQTAYAATTEYYDNAIVNMTKEVTTDIWRIQERLKEAALNVDATGTTEVDLSDMNKDALARYFSHGDIDTSENPYFNQMYTSVRCSNFYKDTSTARLTIGNIEEANRTFAELDSVMDAFKSGLSDSMSDKDKVLYVSKFLNNFEVGGVESGNRFMSVGDSDQHTAGRLFLNHAACGGWTNTANYFLMLSGVMSIYHSGSEEDNHAWNQVRVDEDWYNCDFFWGYLLESDSAITKMCNHKKVSKKFSCTNTQYDGMYGDISKGKCTGRAPDANTGCWASTGHYFETMTLPRTFTLSRQTMILDLGTTYPLGYGNFPFTDDNNEMSISWTSSNPSVATVSNGKVTGVSTGTATITAKTADGLTSSCTVKVEKVNNFVTSGETCHISLYLHANEILGSYAEHEVYKVSGVKVSTYGSVKKLPTPKKGKAKFLGWYTKPVGGEKITDDTVYGEASLVYYLYAHFRYPGEKNIPSNKITYTLKFDGNGTLTGKMSAMKSCKNGKSYKLPANKFVRKGYKFIGWSLRRNGEIKYGDKASFKYSATEKGEIVTLYAMWQPDWA